MDSLPFGWISEQESKRKFVRPKYKSLETVGDAACTPKVIDALTVLVGDTNHKVFYGLLDAAKSNNEYAVYATIYELWKYVRHKPDTFGWPQDTLQSEAAADLWEVYWGAVFRERALWGVGEDDLDWFFTSLLRSRYASVIELFAVDEYMDISQVQQSQEELSTECVTTYHVVWKSTLTDFPPKFNTNVEVSNESFLGYLSTAPSNHLSPQSTITAFGITEDESKKRLKLKLCIYS